MNLEANVGLSFNGDCEAAFKLYARLLGAKLELVMTWGASPLAGSPRANGPARCCSHASRAAHMTLTGADALPGSYQAPTGFNLCLSTNDAAEAERFFAELSAGGTRADAAADHVLCGALRRSRRSFRHSVGGAGRAMNDDRVVSLLGRFATTSGKCSSSSARSSSSRSVT